MKNALHFYTGPTGATTSLFKMDKFEVTQREFQLKMETNMSLFKGADLPVESVTWIEDLGFRCAADL